jgi:hypothetical protein
MIIALDCQMLDYRELNRLIDTNIRFVEVSIEEVQQLQEELAEG